jgi:uncharacterized protein YbjT (DUF2867 family)
MSTAIVIGATGATGQPLVKYLLASDHYQQVIVFCRRLLTFDDPKLTQHQVDFEQLCDWQHLLSGDDLFSAMGTTRRLAGSKAAQYKIDYSYQAGVIAAAKANGVQRLFLISAPGADASSMMFYSRIKGQLDDFAAKQGFATLAIFKPSLIVAERPDKRPAEQFGSWLLTKAASSLTKLPFRPISAEQLAEAMVRCASCKPALAAGSHSYTLAEIFEWL